MTELKGKYANAKIYATITDEASIDQVKTLLDQPFVEGSQIAMMPDMHAGAGCTIGTTMTIKDKVCPNLVGVDIGCGMLAIKLNGKPDFEKLDRIIREKVPYGFNIHEKVDLYFSLNNMYCAPYCNLDRARKSIGTLGGGNHFIEVDIDTKNNYWLVIHTGSRHLGVEVAKYYQEKAITQRKKDNTAEINEGIALLKAEGRQKEIPTFLEKYRAIDKIPNDLCWCEGELLEQYLHDMNLAQEYAKLNRIRIADIIISNLDGIEIVEQFQTIHNYIDIDNMILRKGSVSAQKGEKLIIPMNMKDGSLICIGKGNAEWNYSAPHGAGRIMGRAEAKRTLNLSDFEKVMNGVWSTSVNANTIDEAPMVYKPIETIIENVRDTVDIIDIIKPLYNFKADN